MRQIDQTLNERLKLLISSMGYELVGCESLNQGRQMLFRIYIDKPQGINVEDCSKVSRQISAWMDVEGPFQKHYLLEVSSPGLNRPLFELAHFEKFTGQHIKIKLYSSQAGRRQYKGIILRVEGEKIIILPDDISHEMVILFNQIEKANLIA